MAKGALMVQYNEASAFVELVLSLIKVQNDKSNERSSV